MTENHIERGGYIEAVGRRKTAVARIRISKVKTGITVNGRKVEEFFPSGELMNRALQPLRENEQYENIGVSAVVRGGGSSAQAEAIRHGLTRACVLFNPEDRKHFKDLGFLTRDPRKKERKKFGLRKARRMPQWSKR